MTLGVQRVGASTTVAILQEAKKRGTGQVPIEVVAKEMGVVVF